MLAGLYVPFGFSGLDVLEHSVQLILPKMSFYGSPGLGAGTLSSELAGDTGSSGSLVLIMVPLLVAMSSLEEVSCRTDKSVRVAVVGKGLPREDPLFPS